MEQVAFETTSRMSNGKVVDMVENLPEPQRTQFKQQMAGRGLISSLVSAKTRLKQMGEFELPLERVDLMGFPDCGEIRSVVRSYLAELKSVQKLLESKL